MRSTASIAPILMSPTLFMVPTPREECCTLLISRRVRVGSDALKGTGYLRLRPENVLRTSFELSRETCGESSIRRPPRRGPRGIRAVCGGRDLRRDVRPDLRAEGRPVPDRPPRGRDVRRGAHGRVRRRGPDRRGRGDRPRRPAPPPGDDAPRGGTRRVRLLLPRRPPDRPSGPHAVGAPVDPDGRDRGPERPRPERRNRLPDDANRRARVPRDVPRPRAF